MPRWKYLGNAYVEYLRLPQFPVLRLNACCVWVPENAPKPITVKPTIDTAVKLDGGTYIREADGRAWVLQ